MLLNLSWLIPGLPLIISVFITILLVSFSRTINRLTKPISMLFIFSIIFSTLLSFILLEKHISGSISPFIGSQILNNDFKLYIDTSELLVSITLGLIALIVMLTSFILLKRRTGYVLYFISLGILSGLAFLFVFSGSVFHNLFDPAFLVFEKLGYTFNNMAMIFRFTLSNFGGF